MILSNSSSKATGPVVLKFYIELPWAEGKQFRSDDIYGRHACSWQKPLKLFFSGTCGPITLKFVMYH